MSASRHQWFELSLANNGDESDLHWDRNDDSYRVSTNSERVHDFIFKRKFKWGRIGDVQYLSCKMIAHLRRKDSTKFCAGTSKKKAGRDG